MSAHSSSTQPSEGLPLKFDTNPECYKSEFNFGIGRFLIISWKIPEYFPHSDTDDYALDSPTFTFANATWCFRLCSNVVEDEIAVSLVRLHALKSSKLKIVYKFGIKLGNLGYCSNDKYEILHNMKDVDLNYKQFSFQSSLLDAHQKIFASDSTLDIMCYILYEKSRKGNVVPKKDSYKRERSDVAEVKDAQKTSGTISLKSATAKSIKINWHIPKYIPFEDKENSSLHTRFHFADASWLLMLYASRRGIDDLQPKMSLVRSNSLVSTWHEIIYTFDVILDNVKHHNQHYSDFYFKENEEHVNSILGMPEGFRLQGDRKALENSVTLLCHFFCVESSKVDPIVQRKSSELDNCKTLHQNLKNIQLNGQEHDLILKVKDKEFKVHRNILSVRSQVFESMLTHDMAEKNNGVVNVPDCNPEAMEQFLLYVYSGKMEAFTENNALELYYLADKYNISNLKDESRDFLKKSLSCSNFYEVVQLALTHSDKCLLEYTIDFSTKQNK